MGAGADASLVAKDFYFQPDVDGEVLEKEEKAERAGDMSRNELER